MPNGEFIMSTQQELESAMPLQVITVDLGQNNVGQFGPEDISEAKQHEITVTNADPEYRLPATRRYGCVDGRCSAAEFNNTSAEQLDVADPQMPGGKAIIETAVTMMTQPARMSETLTKVTQDALAKGYTVAVHGANGNKAGCKANEDMRAVLRENAGNIDIVAPTAMVLLTQLGIEKHVTADMVNQIIITGSQAANTEDIWDVDAATAADVVVAAGGEYVDLQGEHHEKAIRVDLAPGAAKKAAMVTVLSEQNRPIQQFIASLGQYKEDIFTDYREQNKSEADAALHVAKAIVYTIGISKHLASPAMPVHLVK